MVFAQNVESDFLQKIDMFSGLPADDMNGFAKAAFAKNYSKGEYIYHQGDEADRFFIVLSGWVRLYREMIDGDESVSHMLSQGDIFGEGIIFYNNSNYIFSAQAAEPVRVFEIPKSILRHRATENPEVAKRVMDSMCDKMIRLEAENERLARMTAAQRVACLLLRLSAHMVGNGGTFTFPYDKSLAASQLGMKRETFSRALVHLKPFGVHVKGCEIKIENFARLSGFSCRQCPLSPDQCDGARQDSCEKYNFDKWLVTHKQP